MENTIINKLLEIQKEIGAISKDSTNPFFHSSYFDINKLLSVVKPILNKHDLVLLQPLTNVDGKPAIKTIIRNSEDGIEDTITLPENTDPQKMGSSITYFRRYAIQSMLGLEAEDDDGNFGAKKSTEKKDNFDQSLPDKPYTPSTTNTASEKQVKLIKDKATPIELKKVEDFYKKSVDSFTSAEASQTIKQLLEKQ